VKELDFDGAGLCKKTRLFQVTEEDLWSQAMAQKDDVKAAFNLINLLAYTQISLMGDIKSEWDIRSHDKFLNHVLTLDEEGLEVVLFHLTLIARGIFFLHKHIGVDPTHQNWVNDMHIAYSIIFCEAFNTELGVVGAIMPERIPVCHPTKDSLKEFSYRQYVLLHQFEDLKAILKKNKSY